MRVLPLTLLALAFISSLLFAEEKNKAESKEKTKEVDYKPKRLLKKDAIPAIFKPKFKSPKESTISKKAPVIGVEIEGEAHCYSIYLLNRHEIVNDEIKGQPFAVTW